MLSVCPSKTTVHSGIARFKKKRILRSAASTDPLMARIAGTIRGTPYQGEPGEYRLKYIISFSGWSVFGSFERGSAGSEKRVRKYAYLFVSSESITCPKRFARMRMATPGAWANPEGG